MSATPSSGSPSWPTSSVDIHISWTLRRPAMQQLADRLAALDLLAAEALAAALRRVRRLAAVGAAHRAGAAGTPAPAPAPSTRRTSAAAPRGRRLGPAAGRRSRRTLA